jgi:hypothetical protein
MADHWHKRLTEESRRADPAGAAPKPDRLDAAV